MKPRTDATRKPRDRIIATARDLFRKHGIRGVGVDAIAEAASTNKMTLYRHFGSRDDLVVACLKDVGGEAEKIWQGFERDYPDDPLAQLRAWVRCGAECVSGDGRGCDMANAAIELAATNHPARDFIVEFKTAQRDRLARLCRQAGVEKAELLADALSLLVEGARVNRQSVGAGGPCARFIAIAESVIAASRGQTKGRVRSEIYAPAVQTGKASPHAIPTDFPELDISYSG